MTDTPNHPPARDAVVEQCDREAAAALAYDLTDSFGGNDEAAMRNGIWDDGSLGDIVQAFARQRLLGEERGREGWIVASGDGKRWRTWKDGWSAWTDDREEATRYHRRRDAEAVHAEDEDAWSITAYATPPAASEPCERTGEVADKVLAEMIAVATGGEDDDDWDEWPIDCRTQVDLWQAALQPILGHHHGFPSRLTALPSTPPAAPLRDGLGRTDADLLRLIAKDHVRLAPNAYHSAKCLEQIADRLDATPPAAVAGEVARLREALTDAIDLLWEHCEGLSPRIKAIEAALAPSGEGEG